MASIYQDRIQKLKKKAANDPGPNKAIKNKIQHLRKSKNSIPQPNPNPRPPNEPKTQIEDKHFTEESVTPTGTVTPTPSNYTPPPGSTGLSSYVPLPGQPDPRDERYWRDVVSLMEKRHQEERELDVQATNSSVAYQEALSNLARQKPRDIQSLKEGANDAGAIYSSRTTEGMGRLEQDYFMQGSQISRSKAEEDQYRSLARDALSSGYSRDEVASLLEAIDRASQAELSRPAPIVDKPEPEPSSGRGDAHNEIMRLRNKLKKTENPKQRRRLKQRIKKAKQSG